MSADLNFAAARKAMVDCQLRTNRLLDERLADAMSAAPRERFVPNSLRNTAYVDEDLPLGQGRYLIEPMIFSRLVQAAGIGPADMVLNVACGTGYAACVMADMAGTVVAIESDSDMATRAADILADLDKTNVAVVEGDLKAGLPDQGPYDVIVIEGAVSEVPDSLLEQMAEGGRLVVVVHDNGVGTARLYSRSNGQIGSRPLFDAATPLLPGFEKAKEFVF